MGNFVKALEYLNKALKIDKQLLGGEHPYTAITYNYFGLLYNEQYDYEKALEFYTKAYNIMNNKLCENHPKTKDVLKSINEAKEALGSNNLSYNCFFCRFFGQ